MARKKKTTIEEPKVDECSVPIEDNGTEDNPIVPESDEASNVSTTPEVDETIESDKDSNVSTVPEVGGDVVEKTVSSGIQIKIDAVISTFKETKGKKAITLDYSQAVKSFVSTAILTLKSEKGEAELSVILNAYRTEEAFKLLSLNKTVALLMPTTNMQKLNTFTTFHTVMNGICDGGKKKAFLDTIDLDTAIARAGLTKARHLF